MSLLHLNLLHCLRREAAVRLSMQVLRHADRQPIGRPTGLDKTQSRVS
jgi:hypothetical protein